VTCESQWVGFYAVEAATGRVKWSRTRLQAKGLAEKMRWRAGAPAFVGDRLFATGGRMLLELDARTGASVREEKVDAALMVPGQPLVTADRLYLASGDKGLVALDRKTLSVVWTGAVDPAKVLTVSYGRHPLRTVATAPFLLGEKLVCAAASDGTIRAWETATGKEAAVLSTGAPYFNAPLVMGDRLVAADFAGCVRSFPVSALNANA
jgi:outer membrane protein assembly factor BamB